MKNSMKRFTFFVFITMLSHQYSFAQKSISITFHNGSLSPIPLVIPGVMNPNLSPMSNSSVTLDTGQVVYYFPNGKSGGKEILFVVEAGWKKDTTLEINKMIKTKMKLKKN